MIINGTDLNLFISGTTGYTAIAAAKSCSLDITAGVIETSSKDSGKWSEKIAGRLSYKVSTSNMYTDDTANGYAKLFTLMTNNTPVLFAYSTDKATKGYIGTAIITNLNNSGEMDGAATITCDMEGTGALTPRA
nr:phage tail tube protein [uncultured Bacteroides sp.]